MFISRRKFEQELEKARNEVLDRVYTDRRIDDIWKKTWEIDRRTSKLEGKPEEDFEIKEG